MNFINSKKDYYKHQLELYINKNSHLVKKIENTEELNKDLILFFNVVKRVFQYNFTLWNNNNSLIAEINKKSEISTEMSSVKDLINLSKSNLINLNEIMDKYNEIIKIKFSCQNSKDFIEKNDKNDKNENYNNNLYSRYGQNKEKEIEIFNVENEISEKTIVNLFEKIDELINKKDKKIRDLNNDINELKQNFLQEKDKFIKIIDIRENEIFTLENKIEKLNNEIKFLIEQINSYNSYIESNKDKVNDKENNKENNKEKEDKMYQEKDSNNLKYKLNHVNYVYLVEPKKESLIFHNKIEFGKSILNKYKTIIRELKFELQKKERKRRVEKNKYHIKKEKNNSQICDVMVNDMNLFNQNSLNKTDIMNIDLIENTRENVNKNILKLSKVNQLRSKSRKPIKKLDLINNSLVKKNQIKVKINLK